MFSVRVPSPSTRRDSSESVRCSISFISRPTANADGDLEKLLGPATESSVVPSFFVRHDSKPSTFWSRLSVKFVLRALLLITSVGLVLWMIADWMYPAGTPLSLGHLTEVGEAYEMVTDDQPPPDPVPVVITEKNGKVRWTVSIPSRHGLPLRPNTYANICSQAHHIATHVEGMISNHTTTNHGHFSYNHVDGNFMDVKEAEELGLLPGKLLGKDHSKVGYIVATEVKSLDRLQNEGQGKICERSLTYLMQSRDAGFGATLMGLWIAYGLALKEERAFFIDDRDWAYGRFSTYFKPPPSQACLPPPDHYRLPCPHHAQHLLVSESTFPFTFGHGFNEEYEDAHGMGVLRQNYIFAFARAGYEALFRLSQEDADYESLRKQELDAHIIDGGMMIGVHVRRGDLHPLEFKYHKSYIPLERYVAASRALIAEAFEGKDAAEASIGKTMSKFILATADPGLYGSARLSQTLRAQDKVLLEEISGWKGGFSPAVFWSLGASPSSATTIRSLASLGNGNDAPEARPAAEPSEQALHLRSLVGRSYVLDLAILGHSDRIVCTVSSLACRLLAVIMGWEKAIVNKGWHNVDGDYDWQGIVW